MKMFEGKKRVITNRQWLEKLDDEKLANFLLKSTINCHNVCSSSECGIAYKCIDGVKMWLQSKHEE